MHNDSFMLQAFVFLLSAVIAVPLAKRVGLGSVMGYLCAGAVIGPFGLGLMGDDVESLMSFAEFGVVLMLFLIGLELDPAVLWRMRISVLGLGGLQVLVTSLLFFAAGLALGFSWQVSLATGSILSLSSTAIVLQTLEEKSLLKTESGQSSFSVLLFQDIAVIPLLAILPLLAMELPELANKTEHIPGWETALKVILVVAAIVLVGRWVSRYLFRIIAETRLRETFTATALMLVVGIALLMNEVGLSPALGTFVAGVVLAPLALGDPVVAAGAVFVAAGAVLAAGAAAAGAAAAGGIETIASSSSSSAAGGAVDTTASPSSSEGGAEGAMDEARARRSRTPPSSSSSSWSAAGAADGRASAPRPAASSRSSSLRFSSVKRDPRLRL